MPTIGTMRLLSGRACLDLVNTVDARRDRWGPDLLQSYEDLLVWSARTQVLDADEITGARVAAARDPRAAADVTSRAVQLREDIAEVMVARLEGRSIPDAAMTRLAETAGTARRHQHLVHDGGRFAWSWSDERPLDRVLHRVSLDAAQLLIDPTSDRRVKLCPGHNCGWLFLDETKNNSRRWCRDEGCGAQARMQRSRARKD